MVVANRAYRSYPVHFRALHSTRPPNLLAPLLSPHRHKALSTQPAVARGEEDAEWKEHSNVYSDCVPPLVANKDVEMIRHLAVDRGNAGANDSSPLLALSLHPPPLRSSSTARASQGTCKDEAVGGTRLHAHHVTQWCTMQTMRTTPWSLATATETHNASFNWQVEVSVGGASATGPKATVAISFPLSLTAPFPWWRLKARSDGNHWRQLSERM
ncbi:hypothetical protein TcWFU_000578 [Taenia crassiceps]|uniref:Uncharacterized protein n=1 Tax=Taenia crassiceps TaxID=6207 RepID=A0ABR4Q4K1_9CEST